MFKTKFILLLLLFTTLIPIQTQALPEIFNQNLVLTNEDIFNLPSDFSSELKIQQYLEKEKSVLATTEFDVGFVDNGGSDPVVTDDIILNIANDTLPISLQPRKQIQEAYKGKKAKASEIIWKLSRENFGNSCALMYSKTGTLLGSNSKQCINNSIQPINPAFILAMIQKESSLVYGPCAKEDADTSKTCEFSSSNSINKLDFRKDRAMGYWCFEREKTQSCFDENPIWKYHKGFFRQVYKGVRLLRMRMITCDTVGFYAYKTGATVSIDGQQVQLQNSITCSLYIYTPHIRPDKTNLYDILKLLTKTSQNVNEKPVVVVPEPIIQPSVPKPTKPSKPTPDVSSLIRRVKPF